MAQDENGRVDIADVDVIAPNFKKRLSGVTSTIIQLVPAQRALGCRIATLSPAGGLPETLPHIRFRDLWRLWRRPAHGLLRVWHARRNIEMLPAIIMRDLLRMPLKIVFTSASQRKHTRWTKFLVARMDRVVSTSRRTASYLERESTVVMHGIDLERFRPAPDKAAARAEIGLDPAFRHVGCFGRIRRQKGTDVFVDAMISLLPGHPGWRAVIAGRTTVEHQAFEQELRARIEQAGLADRILFVGEHTDIERWYRALDLFVAPQRWEGFGLTPLEAMASEVPVVATDVGAFSELVVDGVTGTIIEPGDSDAMSTAVEPLIADDIRRQSFANAALAHTRENFPLQREAAMLVEIYRNLSGGV